MDTTYSTDNRIDGNGQPYQVQIPTPAVSPSTSATSIGTDPLNIISPDNSALSSADTTIKGIATAKQNEVNNLEYQDSNAQSDVTNLSNQLAGETGDQQTLESNAGLPQMQKDLADLNALSSSQLAGYLGKYNALEGGGTGTVGGVSAAETALQRSHAIDALMTNSLIQAKQGNIQAATDSVTKAIAAKYEPIKQQYSNAINILNQVGTKEATAKAALLQVQLKQADNAQQNEKDVQSVVQEAAKNGAPNSVLALMSKAANPNEAVQSGNGFISDPLARKIQLATLAKTQAETAKLISDAKANGQTSISIPNPVTGQPVNVPTNVAPYYDTSNSGVGYVDASTLQGTAGEKTTIINDAQSAGLKVITNKNTATDLFNIKDANNKLDSIASILANIDQPSALSRDLYGLGLTKLAVKAQSNPQQTASDTLSSIGTDILKAMQGVQGSRMSQTAIANINKDLPTIYDTSNTVSNKISDLKVLLGDRENGILGSSGTVTLKNPQTGEVRSFTNLSNEDKNSALKAGFIQQ